MSQLVIGLTGGIGSGKTAASDHFQVLGIDIIDADLVSRQAVTPPSSALQQISEHFGTKYLTPEGELNRAALRQKIFNDSHAKSWLENILHPLIHSEIKHQIKASTSAYCILVSPLLFETRQHEFCQRTLLIDCPKALQIERASTRDNNDVGSIRKIIAQQMSRNKKRQLADDIIVNDSNLDKLYQQVTKQHFYYLGLLEQ